METIEFKKNICSPKLSEAETEKAIALLKSFFSASLSKKLNLLKVEAPLVVQQGTGINDDLNGTERPVHVSVKDFRGARVEIVHSLAKWKRAKLARLTSKPGEGIYTDMRALRPDEDLSDVHSIYVDQWDWEKVILESNRSLTYLRKTVTDIYECLLETEKYIASVYPQLNSFLPRQISFVHSEDLQKTYPHLSPKQREQEICRLKSAVFIIGIGSELADGKKHDGRAPDYDDWTTETSAGKKGLNGDILVWNPVLKRAFEISSMGIRVNPQSLKTQLHSTGCQDRLQLDWHKQLLKGELPCTMGGGIGQSRLSMLLLQKKHIGEVQCSVWPQAVTGELVNEKINLL